MVIPFAVFDIAGYLPTGIRLGGSVSLPAESSQVTAEDALPNDALSAEPIESISDAIPEFHSIITQAEALDNGYVARLNNEEPNLNTLIFGPFRRFQSYARIRVSRQVCGQQRRCS